MAEVLHDADERAQLCDLLDELGPAAVTLLRPWTTRDLAAHLVLREHDLVAAAGLVVPGAWSRLAERRRLALAQRDFSELVATVRSGPPPGFFSGLELVWAGTSKVVRARRGRAIARIAGLSGELLLFLFGRRDVADVEITGESEVIEALWRAPFGMCGTSRHT